MSNIWLQLLPLAIVTYFMLCSMKEIITGAVHRPNNNNFGKH